MTMPGMDGDNTCARFRRNFPDTPIVISSGYMKEDIEQKFTRGNVSAYLAKPFELFSIQSVLRNLVVPAARR